MFFKHLDTSFQMTTPKAATSESNDSNRSRKGRRTYTEILMERQVVAMEKQVQIFAEMRDMLKVFMGAESSVTRGSVSSDIPKHSE